MTQNDALNNLQLDQLWYTWSTSGLGSMPMGYRVRAASPGLYDTLSLRYRLLDRFLYYEMPQGVSLGDFNSRIAPVSLSFVQNGSESLLIRKVFTGETATSRRGNFFTHLIAGLPPDFTARDAIRLWNCPELWAETDQQLDPHETSLPTIPYSRLRTYVEQSQTRFNLEPISEQLKQTLALLLNKNPPAHIYPRGQSIYVAALIYGITHFLPIPLLRNFTFSTYESEIQLDEATILVGTISGAELNNSRGLQIPRAQPGEPISPDIQRYVDFAITSALNDKGDKLNKLIDEIEQHDQATAADLIQQFKRRFRVGPLTLKQVQDIVLHPADNIPDLRDLGMQQEAVHLLLSQPEYLSEAKQSFDIVKGWLAPKAHPPFNAEARDALATCINGMATHVFNAIRDQIMQRTVPTHASAVLAGLVDLRDSPAIYQRMLSEFAQEPLYGRITSAPFWGVQLWLLQCAQFIQPQPALQVMQPWLHTPTWDKLDRVLKLNLPIEWEYAAIFERVQGEVNPTAVGVVKAHEAKFTQFLQSLLQQGVQPGNEGYIQVVLRFFGALIQLDANDHSYPKRAELLLALLNAVPKRPEVIDQLISLFPLNTPYQLLENELDLVLLGCAPEVIAASAKSHTLSSYQKDFILSLTPRKLYPSTIALLKHFHQSALNTPLPTEIVDLVNSWLAINAFLESRTFNPFLLYDIRKALDIIVPQIRKRYAEMHQDSKKVGTMFAQELIPHVLPMVKDQYEIESVLAVFQDGRVEHPWNVLQAMAQHAGTAYSGDLSQLTPYLLCGIRRQQANPTVITEAHLDGYLGILFERVSDNELRDVDKALATGILPTFVQSEWRRWRKSQTSISTSISLTNTLLKAYFPKKQPPTGPQPGQEQSVQQNLPPSPFPPIPPQVRTTIPNEAVQKETSSVRQTEKYIVATIYDQEYSFAYSHCQLLQPIFIHVLPYWLELARSVKEPYIYRRALRFEEQAADTLFNEIERVSPTIISPTLVQYLVDDRLIRYKITREQGKSVSNFLNPENYIRTYRYREEFMKLEGGERYQKLVEAYGEGAINETFTILILRFKFIRELIERKGDWERWLRSERKHVKIKYPD